MDLGVFRDDFYNASAVLGSGQYKTSTQNGGTIAASLMAGAQENYLAFSGQTTAQGLTTDTAANIIAQIQSAVNTALIASQSGLGAAVVPPAGVPNLFNLSYFLQIVNNNTSVAVITLTGGTGVTISGTNTLAITTSRQFLVTITGPAAITMQNVGSGTP